MDSPNRTRISKAIDALVIVALVLVTGFVVVRTVWSGRHAPVPSVFSAGHSYKDAKAASASNGKPVFVVASADWCGPCQIYKRTALADESVQDALEATFVPAYVNVDEQAEAAAELRVYTIPLTAVVQDGEIVARFEGVLGTEDLLELADRYGAERHAAAGNGS